MILVDTSVWVDHFRRGNDALAEFLSAGRVWAHQFVIGELACGNLRRRSQVLHYLSNLPCAPTAGHHEVLQLVERRRLQGAGLGWVDAHLLAAALIDGLVLWTLDRPLLAAAKRLSVSVSAADID